MKTFFKKILFPIIIGFLIFGTQKVFAENFFEPFTEKDIQRNGNDVVIIGRVSPEIKDDWNGTNQTSTDKVSFVMKAEYSKSALCDKGLCDPIIPINVQYIKDGYALTLKNLTPNQRYSVAVTMLREIYRGNVTTYSTTEPGVMQIFSFVHINNSAPNINNTKKSAFEEDYILLAPFAGLRVIKNPAECAKILAKTPTAVCDVSTLISFIFRVLVGLTAVIMVVRLILIGYNYMTTDVLFLKINAKADILASLSGLILALSAWIILNTINPKLIENNFTVSTVSVSGAENNYSLVRAYSGPLPTYTVSNCSVGFDYVRSNGQTFVVCKSIVSNLQKLIDKSWQDNIRLSGGGFRTREDQIAFRKLNCGTKWESGDVRKDCEPDTALPGTSWHESGLAFDFTCDPGQRDGDLLNDFINPDKRPWTKECFTWLQKNASGYGLYNLPTEPWHWSTTGL